MTLVVKSVTEVLTVEEVKDYLKLNPDNDEDELIESYIVAAREYCENRTGRTIALTNYRLTVQSPEKVFVLPRPMIISVDSVTCDGEEVGYSFDYRTITFNSQPQGEVVIDYTAGYPNCPHGIITAMKLLIGHWYAHREAVYVSSGSVTSKSSSIAMGVDAILNQYKVWWF